LLSLFSCYLFSNVLIESENTAALDEARRKALEEEEEKKKKMQLEEATAASLLSDSAGMHVVSLLDSSPDEEDMKPAAAVVQKVTVAKSIQVASPRKRTMEEVQEETKQRVVSQLLEIADSEGVTLNTEAASMEVIEMLSENNQNAYQFMVKSKSIKGTPTKGKSPEIASQLVRRKKSQMTKKTGDGK
jgi:isochorismate synthase EntC